MLHTIALLLSSLIVPSNDGALVSLWGDWNVDGRGDLLLLESGRLRLFEDTGAAGLREVTAAAALDSWTGLCSVLWEDLDGDGAADLLLARPDGDGALLQGLPNGGWRARTDAAGLDLARPLTRVQRTGSALLLEGPDGLRVAHFAAERGWRERVLAPALGALRPASLAADAAAGRRAPTARGGSAPSAPLSVGGSSSSALLPPLNGICAGFVEDQATGDCLPASSLPSLGTLFPLSLAWNVSAAGDVGVGTTSPAAKLDVIGSVRAQQFVSTANAFTAPLVTASNVKVTNLNADRLDGFDASAFSQLGNSIEGSEISPGTITADRLADPLDESGTSVTTLHAAASGLTSVALRGRASGGTGNMGVRGESSSTSGLAYGVRGVSASTTGRALSGEATAVTGANVGVYASTPSTAGNAVQALAGAATGNTVGVMATNASSAGIGVYGLTTKTDLFFTYGVLGNASSGRGAGVLGQAFNGDTNTSATLSGVAGENFSERGSGVRGYAFADGNAGYGVYGFNVDAIGWGVYSAGDLGASGVKSFVQPHPTDASKEIRFVCLEGNESGTYFRGSGTLVDGLAVVDVPAEFRQVSESEGLTVQLTGSGRGHLWVESIDLDRLVVRGEVRDFSYVVHGFRRGFREIELVRENHQWIPEVRGVPYGTQYPEALRRLLVENGTLNADYTPNEATAAAMGWVLLDPAPRAAGSR